MELRPEHDEADMMMIENIVPRKKRRVYEEENLEK